jgi:hypothetical protein
VRRAKYWVVATKKDCLMQRAGGVVGWLVGGGGVACKRCNTMESPEGRWRGVRTAGNAGCTSWTVLQESQISNNARSYSQKDECCKLQEMFKGHLELSQQCYTHTHTHSSPFATGLTSTLTLTDFRQFSLSQAVEERQWGVSNGAFEAYTILDFGSNVRVVGACAACPLAACLHPPLPQQRRRLFKVETIAQRCAASNHPGQISLKLQLNGRVHVGS